ncbi:glutaredoxin family protein [Candidatus Woesearchaeota archaeon]|nr:glutaredoxin family protein [Candidatus Woesearchaeota archaeon]
MTTKIYTTPSCPYCHRVKDLLKLKNVKYTEVDLTTNPKAVKEIIELTGQTGVPVIVINKEVILGFDKSAIEKALKKNS